MLTIHDSVLISTTGLQRREKKRSHKKTSTHFMVYIGPQELKIFPIKSNEISILGENGSVQCVFTKLLFRLGLKLNS